MNDFVYEKRLSARRRVAVIIVTLLFAVVLMFSSHLVLSASQHDCASSESCVVCACIDSFARYEGAKAKPSSLALSFKFVFLAIIVLFREILCKYTLVGSKIRLNN